MRSKREDFSYYWRFRLLTLLFYLKFLRRVFIDLLGIIQPLPEKKRFLPRAERILIFNWRDTKHNYAGGAEAYIHQLAKQWVKEGNKVTLFCGNDGKSKRYESIDGVEVIRRGGFYFAYLWAFIYYLLRFRNKYNVIVDCENGIPFFTPLYARQKIFCLVFHVHQEIFRRSLIKPLALVALFLEKRFMPLVYRNIKFVTISASTKKDIEKLGIARKKIETVTPGVDLKIFKQSKKSFYPLILYLGRLKFYKSVHIFIQAAQKILAKVADAEFIIAGDGEEMESLKKLTYKLDLGKKIKFLGRVTEKEKVKLYQKAWVFVNPSFMEGWAITTIEANACGTPVVVSDVPGLRDSVDNKETGFLVKYGEIDSFAKYTSLLIKNKNLRDQMSFKARLWSEQFSWEGSAAKFLEILK